MCMARRGIVFVRNRAALNNGLSMRHRLLEVPMTAVADCDRRLLLQHDNIMIGHTQVVASVQNTVWVISLPSV